jgi:tRNA A-37 threonylcarbamoyl transferase component Bud32
VGSVTFRLVARTGHPDFLDLPWSRPLAKWESPRFVDVARGIHRHVVRFVDYDGSLYALKELPPRLAAREYRLLRALADLGLPAVETVGVVSERGESEEAVLLTRYLDYSLPYRLVLTRAVLPAPLELLVDAFAGLLVRLHLAGFFWGDCSLSNTLFRRDAGKLSAYLVDAETGELHAQLSDGQRAHDLELARENLYGELLDVGHDDPFGFVGQVLTAYERLWSELTHEEVFADNERFRLQERLRRLHELGFDVGEIELVRSEDGYRLRLQSHVLESGHHRRRLLQLTGLNAQENQARRLLDDLNVFGNELAATGEPPVSAPALAGRWLNEVFEPSIAAIPAELWGKREAAELYHELLEHRWYQSQRKGRDVGRDEALRSYVDFLRSLPDERRAVLGGEQPV